MIKPNLEIILRTEHLIYVHRKAVIIRLYKSWTIILSFSSINYNGSREAIRNSFWSNFEKCLFSTILNAKNIISYLNVNANTLAVSTVNILCTTHHLIPFCAKVFFCNHKLTETGHRKERRRKQAVGEPLMQTLSRLPCQRLLVALNIYSLLP